MFLIIGPRNAGKTLLLRRLQDGVSIDKPSHFDSVPHTISTIGTNLTTVAIGKKREAPIRELGGCLAPLWATYFPACSAVIFVIDASDTTQLSSAWILLLDVLSAAQLVNRPFLLLLNKCDLTAINGLESLLRLDELSGRIHMEKISAKEGSGLDRVVDWMRSKDS